jgi:hypothetical protein
MINSLFVDENAKIKLFLVERDSEIKVIPEDEIEENEKNGIWIEVKRDFSAKQLDEYQSATSSDMRVDTESGEAFINTKDAIKASNSLLQLSITSWKPKISGNPEAFDPKMLASMKSEIRDKIVTKIEEIYGIKKKLKKDKK